MTFTTTPPSMESSWNFLGVLEINGVPIDPTETYEVKVSSDDTTPGFLEDKIQSDDPSISIFTNMGGGNEHVGMDIQHYLYERSDTWGVGLSSTTTYPVPFDVPIHDDAAYSYSAGDDAIYFLLQGYYEVRWQLENDDVDSTDGLRGFAELWDGTASGSDILNSTIPGSGDLAGSYYVNLTQDQIDNDEPNIRHHVYVKLSGTTIASTFISIRRIGNAVQ